MAQLTVRFGEMAAALEARYAELEARVEDRTLALAAEVTERRQAEEGARRASAAKSEFLSRMSHELRTPLNAILGFGHLLELDQLSPEQREGVEQILRAGRHLLRLIDEVLDLSRIEAGRLRLSLEPVAVGAVVREALGLVGPLAQARAIELRMEGVDDTGHVLADGQRLQQVLLNLLSNAIKYNRAGGRVNVAIEETGEGRVRLSVADSGPGIAPDKLPLLFTPFERLGAEAAEIEGTGLGLALSKHLVEAIGGSLTVASEVGVGSTFSVELALAAAPTEALPPASWPPAGGAAEPSAAGLLVLCIEDNPSNLRLIERVLARRPGARLISAIQGRLGLELARSHRPDLILLDRHLPDVPGDEVLRLLREDPGTRAIPVVIVSADASPGEVQRVLAAGARAYLTKPLDVPKLLALLDEHIR